MGKCRLPGIGSGENLTQVLDSQNAIITELEQILEDRAVLPTQDKIVEAGTEPIIISPDEGYNLRNVTINPTPSQSKTITPVPGGHGSDS